MFLPFHLLKKLKSGILRKNKIIFIPSHLFYLEGGFPALLWDVLKDFGYTSYPEYSTREIMTTDQLLRCEVKVKIFVCPTNPAWEEWECTAQGLNLVDTM
jgi:hypothetical protein